MSALKTTTNRIAARSRITDLQERIAAVIDTMESLKVVISNDTINAFK